MKGPQSYLRRTGNSTGFHLTPSQSRDLQGTDVLFKDTPTRKCSPACATGQPLALALCSVRIEDEHGRPLAPGRSGKIAVRGPTTCAGYFNHPDDSARLLRGGWLHTGDSGRIDEAGRLWFLGRLPEKELIKSDGENVYPAEIEAALLEHPGIAQAVVIGVPDAQWGGGGTIKAACVARPGASLSPEEVSEFTGQRIALQASAHRRLHPGPAHESGRLHRPRGRQAGARIGCVHEDGISLRLRARARAAERLRTPSFT